MASLSQSDYKIIVVDDEPNLAEALIQILAAAGFPHVKACTRGDVAIDALDEERFDLLITDYEMPGVKGDEVARKALQPGRHMEAVVISGFMQPELHRTLLEMGVAECIPKPFRIKDIQSAVADRALRLQERLARQVDREAIVALAREAWRRNGYPETVGEEGAGVALTIGRELNLSYRELWTLEMSWYAHDVGMSRIDDTLLGRGGLLNDKELEAVRRHVNYSREMGESWFADPEILTAILSHHEHHNGSGYPRGLAGDAIPLEAKIIALVDSYLSMKHSRPYREALESGAIAGELREQRDRRWDGHLVDLLMKHVCTA